MTTITIQINDNEPKKEQSMRKRAPQNRVPWAIKMGQDICPPGDQFRFI